MSATHPAATPENTRRGIVAGIGAYLIWGLVPIFFKQIVEVPADEIIAHRVVWALLLMTAILGTGRGFGDALRVARIPAQLARIAIAERGEKLRSEVGCRRERGCEAKQAAGESRSARSEDAERFHKQGSSHGHGRFHLRRAMCRASDRI